MASSLAFAHWLPTWVEAACSLNPPDRPTHLTTQPTQLNPTQPYLTPPTLPTLTQPQPKPKPPPHEFIHAERAWAWWTLLDRPRIHPRPTLLLLVEPLPQLPAHRGAQGAAHPEGQHHPCGRRQSHPPVRAEVVLSRVPSALRGAKNTRRPTKRPQVGNGNQTNKN